MINGLRYLTDDLLQLRRMGMKEYNLRMQAAILKQADKQELMAQAALFQRIAKATQKVGDSYFYTAKKLEDIFDKRKIERSVFGADRQEMKQWRRLLAITKNNQEWQRKHVEEA